MKRKDLQELAAIRLKEANLLLRNDSPEGAYYLAGYAVELAFKACIARQTQRHEFPEKKRVNDSHTHNLSQLLRVAGLDDALDEAVQRHAELNENWIVVRDWWSESRYAKPTRDEAEILIKAVGDPKHGIFRWLKRYW